jgi:hypothetical protein
MNSTNNKSKLSSDQEKAFHHGAHEEHEAILEWDELGLWTAIAF